MLPHPQPAQKPCDRTLGAGQHVGSLEPCRVARDANQGTLSDVARLETAGAAVHDDVTEDRRLDALEVAEVRAGVQQAGQVAKKNDPLGRADIDRASRLTLDLRSRQGVHNDPAVPRDPAGVYQQARQLGRFNGARKLADREGSQPAIDVNGVQAVLAPGTIDRHVRPRAHRTG